FQAAAAAICKLDAVPETGSDYRSETLIGVLPGLVIADTTHTACRTTRDSRLAADTGDNLLIHIPRSGAFHMRQAGGEEVVCRAGDVYVDPTEVPGVADFATGPTNALYVSMPRSLFAEADALLRRRTRLTPEWRLFRDYVLNLHRELPHLDPERLGRDAGHVQDLARFALSPEGRPRAESNGLRHARLSAMMRDIERHLTTTRMGIGWIARRHGISERYVRALFAEAGTTFNDHVAGQRLALAHRLLRDPGQATRSISDIALAAGFGDISWFNARFKRTFGMTPRDLRSSPA
ncbi:MAG: AraC family transcriptional regulator, partial [Rhizobiales bacterium]|nr:AraC family transcriptional regulator [Hyphomicrobiales bacterium]